MDAFINCNCNCNCNFNDHFNSKLFFTKLLIFFYFLTSGSLCYSINKNDYLKEQFSTSQIEFFSKEHLQSYDKSSFFSWSKFLQISWAPEWNDANLPSDCQTEEILSQFYDLNTQTLQSFWNRCEPRIRNYSPSHWNEILHMIQFNYDILNHPLAHEVMFHLPNDINVRGILFLKNLKPRPLVIIRPGIFSSFSTMMAERFTLIQFFDESDFNVLVIPSLTGKQFIEDNNSFIYGGFEEGIHTFLIAQLLKENPTQQPIAKLITQIHTVGVSMGSHGVLFANLLDKISNKNLFEKSIYYCPLMDLEKTFTNYRQNYTFSLFSNYWVWKRLAPLRAKNQIPFLSLFQGTDWLNHWTEHYTQPLVGWDHLSITNNDSFLKRYSNLNFEKLNKWDQWKLWNQNSTQPNLNINFNSNSLSYSNTDVNISINPSLVFYSETDPVVPPENNILNLKNEIKNVTILNLPKGFHCSVPVNYNETFMSKLVNSFLLKNKIKNGEDSKPIWKGQFTGTYKFSNYKLVDLEPTEQQTLKLHYFIRNQLTTETILIEIPNSTIDIKWNDDEWSTPLKYTLMRWLQSHLILKNNKQLLLF